MPAVSREIRFFLFGEYGVLFHQAAGRLWVLNPVAATVWCLLPDTPDGRALPGELAQRFGISRVQAEEDAGRCLAMFRREGLLEGGQPDVPVHGKPREIPLEEVSFQTPGKWALETVIRLKGATVRLCSQNGYLGEEFVSLVRHLRSAGTGQPADADLFLAREGGKAGWSVLLDGRRYVGGVPDSGVVPHLLFLLCECAMRGLNSYFLFHGAVLERYGTTLVLPGEAGSGKTTLAALLVAEGWRLFSDELVVLDTRSGEILPFPLPMSIKQGSVEVLKSLYPGLERLRIWDRSDGKQVRYLLPHRSALPLEREERTEPTLLVFPQYVRGGATRLTGLERMETLQRLAATGSSNRLLREADVEAMIDLVTRCPSFSLVYNDARQAYPFIGKAAHRGNEAPDTPF